MNATIQFTCPLCQKQMKLPSATVGQQWKCPGCGQVVTFTAGSSQTSPINPVAQIQPVLVQPVAVSPPAVQSQPTPASQHVFQHINTNTSRSRRRRSARKQGLTGIQKAVIAYVAIGLFAGIISLVAFRGSSGPIKNKRSSNSSTGISSSVQQAKDALMETSRKMDGDFARVMHDIVQSAETGGAPWSICDKRAYGGHFSSETLAAYQKWRSAMLAD